MFSPSRRTITTPKCAPTVIEPGNNPTTSSGRALGGHVVILCLPAQQGVTHAAAREQRLMPGGGESLDDGDGGGFHSVLEMRMPTSCPKTTGAGV